MNVLIAIVSVYLALCAVLPAIIGLRRGLSRSQIAVISITGATLGWTGYGALVAWLLACFDDPKDGGLRIQITITDVDHLHPMPSVFRVTVLWRS